MEIATIEAALAREGLIPRGGFHPEPGDGVPGLENGAPARTLVLVGNAGPEMWRAFAASPEFGPESGTLPDPLDRWSARVIGELAEAWGARALYPFGGPPHLPFVAWAKRAEAVAESPLGILIHPDYGLWHAYRGALAFAEAVDLAPRDQRPRPCDTCAERPCLSACPVGAFTETGYDVAACTGHISAPAGIDCMERACGARRACPVGRGYIYEPAQARFHMEHFLAARRRAGAAA
ncbi:MAG: 4Fe-4S dicluster domain-containing protein [Proteobacteria bacterium]|nr:4Fe-4S dicluster domain-containing protein [Pseudomonadota bacterium]